ncbi:hypothetical protein [Aeromicrobium sp.]|uniref:hypothetical protein n=1 Tax=Aeromicrobium sp. TaxID=1871063 RepID=UPI0030C60CBD
MAAIVPPVLIALVGIAHPARLTFEDAILWRNLHVVLLPLFPLVALGPWLVTRSIDRAWGRVSLLLGFVYACFYSALDVLAGIGAGGLKDAREGGLGVVFGLAGDLGQVGSVALIGANALACGCVLRIVGAKGAPGTVLLLAGSYGFMEEHVYWPGGVLSMLAIAAGWAALLIALRRAQLPLP